MADFIWTNKGALTQIVGKAVKYVAYEVERDTKIRCPVDTGNLRRSYATQYEQEGDTHIATVGTNVDYAIWVELGTRRGRAQPHLGPALEKARNKYGGGR